MRENVRDLMKKNTYEPTPGNHQFDNVIGNAVKQSTNNNRTPTSRTMDNFFTDLMKPSSQIPLKSSSNNNFNEPLRTLPNTNNRGTFNDYVSVNPPQSFNSPSFRNPQFTVNNEQSNLYNTAKFQRSKMECLEQLSQILQELDRKEGMLKNTYVSHNDDAFQKFISDYDNLAKQIMTVIYAQLQEQKQIMIKQLQDRRSGEYVEAKPILKNIQNLRNEIIALRNGLSKDQEYRRYIIETVPRDFQIDLHRIQNDMNKIRFPNVQLWIDQKHFECIKNDLQRIILARDELTTIVNRMTQQAKSQKEMKTLHSRNPFGDNPTRSGGGFFDFIFR